MKKFIAIITLLSVAGLAQAQTTNTPPARAGFMRENNSKPQQQVKLPVKIQTFKIGSSTRPMMGSTTRPLMSSTTRPIMGSTTKRIMAGEKRELKMTAKKEAALTIKTALVERLTKALNELTLVKTNLSTYIDKQVAAGKSVGNAKTLLATANTKIETARKAIAAVVAWKPDVKAASSTEISLTKPRETANTAIKAVNDARQAIHAVINELRSNKTKPAEKKVEVEEPIETTNQ